jgi:hypothetical protein
MRSRRSSFVKRLSGNGLAGAVVSVQGTAASTIGGKSSEHHRHVPNLAAVGIYRLKPKVLRLCRRTRVS